MPVPVVEFSDERLANGLRLIVAEDHLAPVVAVNVWYNVGSKHEVPGKTGFAHLFEHVMFQGSANVGKAEHMALVQAAGGTLNGTTWVDRTNYFETMPVAPAGARDLARGGPDGHAPRGARARRTSTTSATWSRTRSAGATTTGRTAPGWRRCWATSTRRATRTTTRRSGRWRTSTRPRSRTSRPSSGPTTCPTTRCCRSSGDCDRAQVRAWAERYFGPIAPNPAIPPLAGHVPPARSSARSAARPSRTRCRWRASTSRSGRPAFGDRRLDAHRPRRARS